MKSFSERMGITPPKAIQLNELDQRSRARIWNAVHNSLRLFGYRIPGHDQLFNYSHELLKDFFVISMADFRAPQEDFSLAFIKIEELIMKGPWNRVFDYLEFTLVYFGYNEDFVQKISDELNAALEKEMVGYRCLRTNVIPITNNDEISSITVAIKEQSSSASEHIQQALQLLANRENPDYRNSVKESISAVEAMCRDLTGNPKAILSDALKAIRNRNGSLEHPAFLDAMQKLYGYAGDAGGIRHSVKILGASSEAFTD